MVAHTNSKLQEEESKVRFGPTVKRKRMSRPRKKLNCGQGRDFFRLAAAFASVDKHESDFHETSTHAPKETVEDLAYSKYLQTRYQERSTLFTAKPNRTLILDDQSAFMCALIDKWHRALSQKSTAIDALFLDHVGKDGSIECNFLFNDAVSKNGVCFSAREMAVVTAIAEKLLLKGYLHSRKLAHRKHSLRAQDFHQALKAIIEHPAQRHFVLMASVGQGTKLLVERARLFWSHRLQIKSLQIADGAEPSIYYFHAALGANHGRKSRIDFLYWLKIDDEKNIINGDFIKAAQGDDYPCDLFYPLTLLCDPERFRECLATLDPAAKLFVEAARVLLFVH